MHTGCSTQRQAAAAPRTSHEHVRRKVAADMRERSGASLVQRLLLQLPLLVCRWWGISAVQQLRGRGQQRGRQRRAAGEAAAAAAAALLRHQRGWQYSCSQHPNLSLLRRLAA
jgi:hypothetical protein